MPVCDRLRYELAPARETGRRTTGRLRYAEVSDPHDPRLRSAYEDSLAGTLDAWTVVDLRLRPPAELAHHQMTMYADSDGGDLSGWRIALAPDGEVAGLVMASVWSPPRGCVSFVGVRPEHRGRGYAAELVAWAVDWLAARDVDLGIGETASGSSAAARTSTGAAD